MAFNKLTPEQRLLTKARPAENGCLVWFGDTDSNGYGRLRHAGRKVYGAHKLMFELRNGPIPAGLVVRHTCDNPPCINPDHLILGTQKQNVADKYERGRSNHVTGEQHGRAKLTQAQVDEARARYVPGKRGSGIRVLAREFGVAMSTMASILTGDHWKGAK